jgi:hypothetical protein
MGCCGAGNMAMIRFVDVYTKNWLYSLHGFFGTTVSKDGTEYKAILSTSYVLSPDAAFAAAQFSERVTIATEPEVEFELSDIVQYGGKEWVVIAKQKAEAINYYGLGILAPETIGEPELLP